MTNTNPITGIRYGVIAFNNLDPDLGQELWYTYGRDLSWEAAERELRAEIEREADAIEGGVWEAIEEEAEMKADEVGGLTDREREDFVERLVDDHVERRVEEMYESKGYDDRQDYVESRFEREREQIQIEEPVIEGEYEGVKYRIDWLGGAPLLWVFEGPVGTCRSLCSPCVPNAGDLDSGYSVGVGLGYECYVVPRDWLRSEE